MLSFKSIQVFVLFDGLYLMMFQFDEDADLFHEPPSAEPATVVS